jgi:hypothetical protein
MMNFFGEIWRFPLFFGFMSAIFVWLMGVNNATWATVSTLWCASDHINIYIQYCIYLRRKDILFCGVHDNL